MLKPHGVIFIFSYYFNRLLLVPGGYSPWSSWGVCSKSCDRGTQTRSRACTSPPPAHGGRDCRNLGQANELRRCNTQNCPGKDFT